MSDDSLLSILSDPTSVVSIQPHLISLFGAMNNIVLAPSVGKEDPVITAVESVEGERLDLISRVCAEKFNECEIFYLAVMVKY